MVAQNAYIMYLRKSRADAELERRGKYETLAEHERVLTALAESQGLEISEVCKELVSGETIAARPVFQHVLELVQRPECAGVICHAVDRLGRGDPMEYGYVLSVLRFSGCRIVTPHRTYDTANPTDLQQLKLQMFVSNIEFDHIRERLHEGSRRAVERGCYIGSVPPYGYRKVKVDGQPTLEPDEAEAPTLKLIFALACDGWNKGMIARHLNGSGILTRHGKLWTAGRIHAVLSNPIYKGTVRYGLHPVVTKAENGLIVKGKGTDLNCLEAVGLHPPLVSESDWQMANELAHEAVPVQRDKTIKNPLAGRSVCGKCGRALVRQSVKNAHGKKFDRLHHAYGTACQIKSVSLPYVMMKFCDALEAVTRDVPIEQPEHADELQAIDAAILEQDARLDKLVDLYCKGALSVDEFKVRRERSASEADRLRARRDVLASKAVSAQKGTHTASEVLELIRGDSTPPDKVNAALRMLVERVEYFELDTARRNRSIKLVITLR